MADIETGHKWWIRYVGVPLVVALLGLLVFLMRPKDSVIKVPRAEDSQRTDKPETVEVAADAVHVQSTDELYVVDEHNHTFTKDVRVRKNSVFTAKWDARQSSSGQLHLLILGNNGRILVNTKVGQMGQQGVRSDDPITLKIAEEYAGKLRPIKTLPVQMF